MRDRAWIGLAALFGLLAVAAGAFAAHGLEARGDTRAVALVETGARYQMWHALAMLAYVALGRSAPGAVVVLGHRRAAVLAQPVCAGLRRPDAGWHGDAGGRHGPPGGLGGHGLVRPQGSAVTAAGIVPAPAAGSTSR